RGCPLRLPVGTVRSIGGCVTPWTSRDRRRRVDFGREHQQREEGHEQGAGGAARVLEGVDLHGGGDRLAFDPGEEYLRAGGWSARRSRTSAVRWPSRRCATARTSWSTSRG